MNARPLLAALTALCLVAPIAAQQRPAPAPTDQARQPFVIERFHQRLRYDEQGTGRIELEARIRVQTEAGVEGLGQLDFPYDSSTQRLDVDSVRVLKAGGSVVLVPRTAVLDESAPVAREAPVFSDLREKIVTVPALRPGDVLEYHLTWTIHTPLAPGQFWYSADFIRRAVVLDQRLSLDVPRGKYVRVRTIATDQPSVSEEGDRRIYTWRTANLHVDTAEQGAGHGAGKAVQETPSVSISTFHSWEEVGRWYADLERGRETPTAAIRAKADSLVRTRSSLQDSIAAVYDFVSKEFRYVSLSFGVGRYQPHAASEVLANQYGDCKDKHTLLASLLRAIGVVSAPALISTEHDPDSTTPSPEQFDHVITMVRAREDTLWLDVTPGVAPFRFLLFPLRGKRTLVAPLDGPPQLLRTPAEPPFAQFHRVSVEGQISGADRFTATYRHVLRGDEEVVLRLVLRNLPEDRLGWFAQQVAREEELVGTVSAARGGDPGATRDPIEFSFQVDQPLAIDWSGPRARYRVPLPPLGVGGEDSGAAGDTVLLALGEQTVRLRLELPPGVTAEPLVPVMTSRDYGSYRSSYQLRDRTLIVERVLTFTERRLPPGRRGDLAAFRRSVRDDEGQLVALTRAVAPPSAAGGADLDALHQAGVTAFERRDIRGAIRLLRQVVARNPQHQAAWNDLGRAYLEIGQLDSAGACFRRQVAINPYDQFAYNNLGLALWRSHRNEDAAAAFRQQIQVSPLDRYAHANLGELALELHQDSLAVSELRVAVGIVPSNPGLHSSLGRAYVAAGQSDAAVAEFDRAIEIRPMADQLNTAAYALALGGVRLDRAERYARAAIDSAESPLLSISLDETDPMVMFSVATLASLWDTLGWVFFQRGDLVGAERYLRSAWLLNSNNGAIGDHLAQLYERQGRRAEAVHTYALALATDRAAPPEARAHLAAIAGGAARANRLVEEAAHGGLQAMRTVRLGRTTRIRASGVVELLLGPGPRVEDLRFSNGGDELRPLADAIRAAGPSFPIAFPDSTPIRVPRRGVVGCSPASGCSIVLMETPMSGSFTQTLMVPHQE